jgi:ATP-dependent DNA ligase
MKATIEGLAQRAERKKRSGIMLCYPFEEKRLKHWGERTVFVQPKLDGERARLVFDGEQWTFWSSTEEPLNFAVPHLCEALAKCTLPRFVHLDGELYAHGLPFEEIHSRVSRTRSLHPEHSLINFHVFDLCDGEAAQWSRLLQLRMLQRNLPEGFQIVPSEPAESLERIFDHARRFTSEGYEGIIVRRATGLWVPRRSTDIMKFKPKQHDSYTVIGVEQLIEQSGSKRAELGALVCEADGESFKVGTGFTRGQREALWKAYLEGPELFTGGSLEAVVEYQHITSGSSKRSKGVPRFPVFVSLQPKGESDETL